MYLADDTRDSTPVALKLPRLEVLLDDQKRKRFRVEADIIRQLEHPGIVRIRKSGVDDTLPYTACDWCTGPDLAVYMDELRARNTLPPWQESVRLMLKVCQAIKFAHENGITHRDIKPANILLDRIIPGKDADGDQGLNQFAPRITDFGLARLADATPLATSTRTGVVMGTPAYMAPERILAGLAVEQETIQQAVSPATDIYSLGAVLFELLCGAPPASSQSWLELIRNENRTTDDSLQWTASVPAPVKKVVAACLRGNPETRYSSVAQLEADLLRLHDGQPPIGRPIRLPQRFNQWFRSKSWFAMAGWFAIVSQAIIASWLITADIFKVSFGLLTSAEYFELLPQLMLIAATNSLSVIVCGWLCLRRWAWAPCIGLLLAGWNLWSPLKALFGEPFIFENIYNSSSPYMQFSIHLVIAFVTAIQLLLFGTAVIERLLDFRSKRNCR